MKLTKEQKVLLSTLKEVKKVLDKHYLKEYVKIHKDIGTISFPAGIIIPSDDRLNWMLTIDYSWMENTNDDEHGVFGVMSLMYTVKDLSILLPNLDFDPGFYTIFNNDGEYAGTLGNSDILDRMQETGLYYSAAKTVLEREIIEKNKEKSE